MDQPDSELKEMLRDMIKINAVIATEMIQLVENSSKQLRGEIPETCKVQHGALKKEVVEIAEKWHRGGVLREHNVDHE